MQTSAIRLQRSMQRKPGLGHRGDKKSILKLMEANHGMVNVIQLNSAPSHARVDGHYKGGFAGLGLHIYKASKLLRVFSRF